MSYQIVEIELQESTKARLPGSPTAIIWRYRGHPVGFQMHDCPGCGAAAPARLDRLLSGPVMARIAARAAACELPAPLTTRGAPSVTVAICTRDRPDLLGRCLASLGQLDPSAALETCRFEILVVDNAPSDDRTRALVADRAGIRYVCEPRPGLNFARNSALSSATGDLVAFLDDDVVVDKGWIAGLAAAFRDEPEAGFYTGQVLPYALETPAQVTFEQRGGFRRGFEREYFGTTRENDRFYPCGAGVFGTGANMAVQRQAALEIGGFDVALDTGRSLPGGGDLDMFYRLIRAGHSAVYEPAYLVFHEHRRDSAALRRQYRDSWGKAFIAFAVKSWAADPQMRTKWAGLVAWWFGKQMTDFVRRLGGRSPRPLTMIAAELTGGLAGLFGEYGRSGRRVRRIEWDAR